MPAKRIKIFGRVQGVFFRQSAKDKADELGIVGWAQNQPDSSVLIEADGHDDDMEEFIAWCNEGPEGAEVEKVECVDIDSEFEDEEFVIRY